MPTLISQHNSDGETGRCDAKCYNATQPVCKCCCRGANHGVGLKQAVSNTEALIDELTENLPEVATFKVHERQNVLF